MKYLHKNKGFDNLTPTNKSLICMAVNRLGDTGIYIESDNVGFVVIDHVTECLKRSLTQLSPEGVAVVQEISNTLGVEI